jgi:hypothetical protein
MSTTFHAFYSDGTEVKVGDDLTNFRGESGYKFVSASPSRGSGHVHVTTPDGGSRQYYPRVFGLQEPIMADSSGVSPVGRGLPVSRTERGPRPIHEIADEIGRNWKNVYFGAVPYLNAMQYLESITDKFGEDDADEVIIYFLSNAKTWRGDVARRVKAELNGMLKQGR